jgi:tetratricopeptide (TPR) repeat protein
VQERLGNYDSAIQMSQISVKLNPGNVTGHYNLAVALDKKGSFGEAIPAYEKAVELEHKNKEEIKKRIQQLKGILNLPSYKYGFKMGG